MLTHGSLHVFISTLLHAHSLTHTHKHVCKHAIYIHFFGTCAAAATTAQRLSDVALAVAVAVVVAVAVGVAVQWQCELGSVRS